MKLVESTPIMEQEVTIKLPVKQLAVIFSVLAKSSTSEVRDMVAEIEGFEALAETISGYGDNDIPYVLYKQIKEIFSELGMYIS
jgi:hypothetical protein